MKEYSVQTGIRLSEPMADWLDNEAQKRGEVLGHRVSRSDLLREILTEAIRAKQVAKPRTKAAKK